MKKKFIFLWENFEKTLASNWVVDGQKSNYVDTYKAKYIRFGQPLDFILKI